CRRARHVTPHGPKKKTLLGEKGLSLNNECFANYLDLATRTGRPNLPGRGAATDAGTAAEHEHSRHRSGGTTDNSTASIYRSIALSIYLLAVYLLGQLSRDLSVLRITERGQNHDHILAHRRTPSDSACGQRTAASREFPGGGAVDSTATRPRRLPC